MMGWDMRMGLDAAHGTYIGVIDGDEQFPTEAVVDCLLKAETEGLDLVKTYRVVRHDGLYRRFISAAFNTSFRLLFGGGVRDVNSKPKIIRRDKYELLDLKSDDWFIDAELVLRARELGLKIGEIPIHFGINNRRPSFVRPSAMIEFGWNLARYRFGPARRPPADRLQQEAPERPPIAEDHPANGPRRAQNDRSDAREVPTSDPKACK
jgi:glycosyltransferase involved in cell wall biosynthesis